MAPLSMDSYPQVVLSIRDTKSGPNLSYLRRKSHGANSESSSLLRVVDEVTAPRHGPAASIIHIEVDRTRNRIRSHFVSCTLQQVNSELEILALSLLSALHEPGLVVRPPPPTHMQSLLSTCTYGPLHTCTLLQVLAVVRCELDEISALMAFPSCSFPISQGK